MADIHPLIPTDFVNNLDFMLDEVKTDMGFKTYDNKSCPEIYQGLSILYFTGLGFKIAELDPSKQQIHSQDLLYQLSQKGLISAKPSNHKELKLTFNKLFEGTSEYLRNLK
mgnify:CR=1 FL=1